MSIRSALQIGRAFPPAGNQDLDSVLKAGNTANQQDILGVGNLVCATINGDPIGGSQGLASVLGISDVGGQKDIQDVDNITCNKLVELGRSKYFEYIVGDTFTVNSAAAFQIDISGGQITLEEGSYVFNFTINLSANIAVENYSILLDLDGTILGKTTVQAPNTVSSALTTLIINSLPVTRVLPAAGVVTLKCIVNAPVYPVTVSLTGPPSGNAFSYLSWVEVYLGPVPPPLYGYPFTATGTQPLQIDVNGNEYIYYMKTPGFTTLTPNYSFTLDEIFVVGAGKNGSGTTGGDGGGVVSYLTPSIIVTPANFFTITVAKEGGNSAAAVAGYAITLDSSQDLSPAAGGTANNNGNPGTQYDGLYYGGSGAGGGTGILGGSGANGKTGGLGGGGGSGSFSQNQFSFSGGAGGGDGVNSGGAGGTAGGDGASSQYGAGGGDGYYLYSNGGEGGNGGSFGGIGGGGAPSVGGGGGGGGNLGGGGGGGGGDQDFSAGAGGGGAGIVIIKLTI